MKQWNNETINTISNYLSDILKEWESNNKIFEELVKMVKIIWDISSSVEKEEARKGFARTVIELIQENKLKPDDLEKFFAEDLSQKVKKRLDEISVRLIADELIKTFEQNKVASEYIVAVIFGLAKGEFLTAPVDAEKYGKKLLELIKSYFNEEDILDEYIKLVFEKLDRKRKENFIYFMDRAIIFNLWKVYSFIKGDEELGKIWNKVFENRYKSTDKTVDEWV